MELKETACWPAKVTGQHPHDPLRQRVCRVVMYARRAEIRAEARSFVELNGFMPEITDPDERYHAAIKMVCEMWFFLGPQEIDLSNKTLNVQRSTPNSQGGEASGCGLVALLALAVAIAAAALVIDRRGVSVRVAWLKEYPDPVCERCGRVLDGSVMECVKEGNP